MEIDFSPKGKRFIFKLDKYTCYKVCSGKCPITPDKVSNYNFDNKYYYGSATASCEKHCLNIAKSLIESGFTSNKLTISKFKCGHYMVGTGQHRVCVAGRLGLTVPVRISKIDINCEECYRKKESLTYRIKGWFFKGDYIEERL